MQNYRLFIVPTRAYARKFWGKIPKKGKGVFMQETGKKNFTKIGLGAVIGAVNAFFGGGGGMLAVPLLQKSGQEKKSAHATAILVILPISLLSFLFYALNGFYDWKLFIPVAIGVSAGGFLGAKVLGKLPKKWVEFTFALLQLWAGISLIFMRRG